ncbi:MAG TPA: rod shape-determining protein MreC, partial [Pyrinomonadaceae bacterium]|nr:rod shape-determining protein MreC [Pyrinomonadaceae bacterium]
MPIQRTQSEIRRRAPAWLVGLLAVSFAMATVSARDQATQERKIRVWAQAAAVPVQSLFSGAAGGVGGLFQYFGNMRRAAGENETLRHRLAETEARLREAEAASAENERLRGLLGLQDGKEFETVAARVVARDPSQWFDSVIINRGSSSGIEVNMPVVTPEGIVGRVAAVSPVSAQVMLLTDERAAAGAAVGQLEGTHALGSVRGFGTNGLLDMRYVSGLEKLPEVGTSVLTTGQDGIYPRGLKLGEVVEAKAGTATTSHEIRVRPGARLNSL